MTQAMREIPLSGHGEPLVGSVELHGRSGVASFRGGEDRSQDGGQGITFREDQGFRVPRFQPGEDVRFRKIEEDQQGLPFPPDLEVGK
jgi:hypothetical protein